MKFPKTYIDIGQELFDGWERQFAAGAENLRTAISTEKRAGKLIDTGTTIAAVLSTDKKIGVIASDGRVSAEHLSFKEDFPKVFNCRLGFIGCAGVLALIQRIMPPYRAVLDQICDSRNVLISSSGAMQQLYHFYEAVAGGIENGVLEMIPLFWDAKDRKCHLYKLAGLSHLDCDHAAVIGSGSASAGRSIEDHFPQANSKEELLGQVREYIRKASRGGDTGTNRIMFAGVIDRGRFETLKGEVL